MATVVWNQNGSGLGLIPQNQNSPQPPRVNPAPNSAPNPDLNPDQEALIRSLTQRLNNELASVVDEAHHLQSLERTVDRLEQNLTNGGGGIADDVDRSNEIMARQQRQIKEQDKKIESMSTCMKILRIIGIIFLVLLGGALLL